MEDRIGRVADSKLTPADLWSSVSGSAATRESRMEVVAWMAVCKFNCSLEGGFVRDWIVANERQRPPPTIQPSEWVIFDSSSGTPSLIKTLVPSDLDCKMPLDRFFDVQEFCEEISKFDMKPELYRSRRSFRLLFDRHHPTGPFIMDLIEPYIVVGFRIPDLDVNNLCVKRDQCKEFSQRIDLSEPPYSIDLQQIIKNIKCKQFHVLPSINGLIAARINKMVVRGWVHKGVPLIDKPQQVIPKFLVTPLAITSDLYKRIESEIQQIGNSKLICIEQIHNIDLENIYESMKKLIADQCLGDNPNEQFLFHGIHTSKGQKIMDEGFDYGFFKTQGLFGNGAYFAENLRKSHQYTLPTNDVATRIIFYNKVVLGQEMIMSNIDSTLCAAPHGHHSVRSVISDTPEYIVYRLTQVLPILIITYRIQAA